MHENLSNQCATPAWILRSYVDSMLALGATASEDALSIAGEKLLFRWGAAHRVFHNTLYLASVITHIDELSGTCHDPNLLRVVAWYMGAVEPVNVYLDKTEREARLTACTQYLTESATGLGIPAPTVERLVDLLAHTLSHDPSLAEVDAAVLNDADLAILAGTPQEYKKFRLAIREENRQLSDVDFLVARQRFVKSLLQRKNLFKSPVGAHWEASARQNLQAELANLDASLALLSPAFVADADWQDEARFEDTQTAALVFKRSALDVPISEDVEQTSCALPRFVTPCPEATVDDTSSLEFEPTVLDKRPIGAVRRLSAKELARQAAKRKQAEQ